MLVPPSADDLPNIVVSSPGPLPAGRVSSKGRWSRPIFPIFQHSTIPIWAKPPICIQARLRTYPAVQIRTAGTGINPFPVYHNTLVAEHRPWDGLYTCEEERLTLVFHIVEHLSTMRFDLLYQR